MNYKKIRYVTAEQMREIDRKAIVEYGIPSIVLMENAGRAVAEKVVSLISNIQSPPHLSPLTRGRLSGSIVAIVCGGGNNGGDGFVVARHLVNNGIQTIVYYTKKPEEMTPDAKTNFLILKKMNVPTKLINQTNISAFDKKLKSANIVVDALLGTGTKGKIKGLYADIIRIINKSKRLVVAVDIPSGMDADTGEPLVEPFPCSEDNQSLTLKQGRGECVKARITVTLALPKKGFLNPKSKQYAGKIFVADIGIPKTIYKNVG